MNSPVKLLRVPIRVLPIYDVGSVDANLLCNDTTEELTPANPFLEVRQKETPFDVALQTLQNITARRNPNFYMISNTWGKVARFCLFKPAYKLGEDIIGTFDFTVATVHCVQVSVSLQCEEETVIDPSGTKNKQTRIITYSKHHEVCLGYNYTQLILPIPLHVTPTFTTDLGKSLLSMKIYILFNNLLLPVSLKWRLHFEFVTSTSKDLDPPYPTQNSWQAPTDIPIETMVWSLPIKLFSTTPMQVAQGLQTNTVHKMALR